jgi:hypothetical protein
MEQVNESRYRVKPGETIAVRVGGIGVSPTQAVFSSSPEATFEPQTGKYEFTVNKPAGKIHVGRLSAAFPTGTPDNAQFTTVVSGSLGGSFIGPTISKTDQFKAAGFTFEVV